MINPGDGGLTPPSTPSSPEAPSGSAKPAGEQAPPAGAPAAPAPAVAPASLKPWYRKPVPVATMAGAVLAVVIATAALTGHLPGFGKQAEVAPHLTAVASHFAAVPAAGTGFPAIGSFWQASCPAARTCYVTGAGTSGVVASTVDGTHWSTATVTVASSLDAIACSSAKRCYAVGPSPSGDAVIVATADGKNWILADDLPGGVLTAIACPTDSSCIAVGSDTRNQIADVVATSDGGRTWVRRALPQSGAEPMAVACVSASQCIVAGSGAWTTSDLGAGWHAVSPSPPAGQTGAGFMLGSVTYASASEVWAVGGRDCAAPAAMHCQAWIYHSRDGGATWTSTPPVSQAFPFARQVLCDSSGCVLLTEAATSSSLMTSADGTSWRLVQTLPASLAGLACSAADFCVAGGSSGTAPVIYRAN